MMQAIFQVKKGFNFSFKGIMNYLISWHMTLWNWYYFNNWSRSTLESENEQKEFFKGKVLGCPRKDQPFNNLNMIMIDKGIKLEEKNSGISSASFLHRITLKRNILTFSHIGIKLPASVTDAIQIKWLYSKNRYV